MTRECVIVAAVVLALWSVFGVCFARRVVKHYRKNDLELPDTSRINIFIFISGPLVWVWAATGRICDFPVPPVEKEEKPESEHVDEDVKEKLDKLMSAINEDESLKEFEEHLDILHDMNLAYKSINKVIAEKDEIAKELDEAKKSIEELLHKIEDTHEEPPGSNGPKCSLCDGTGRMPGHIDTSDEYPPDEDEDEEEEPLIEAREESPSRDLAAQRNALLFALKKIRDKSAPKDRLSSMRRHHEQVLKVVREAIAAAEDHGDE